MKFLTKIEGSCAVIALCYAANITEEEALRVCLDHNFKFNDRGMFDAEWKRAASDFGLKLEKSTSTPVKLRNFIKNHQNGLFLMSTHNHLFVLNDGNIIDPIWGKPGLSRMIIQAHRVINPQL